MLAFAKRFGDFAPLKMCARVMAELIEREGDVETRKVEQAMHKTRQRLWAYHGHRERRDEPSCVEVPSRTPRS